MQFIQLIVHPASSTDKREKCLKSDVRRKIRKLLREVRRCLLCFWLIWFINQSLVQSCFVHHALSLALSLSVHTPWHRVRHRSFVFCIHMHIYSSCMYIRYLVILTCSFLMAAILVLLFDLLSSHRDFILHLLMYILFTFIHKRNNATVIFFLKFVSIFL